jgi:hypothetical protein
MGSDVIPGSGHTGRGPVCRTRLGLETVTEQEERLAALARLTSALPIERRTRDEAHEDGDVYDLVVLEDTAVGCAITHMNTYEHCCGRV